MMGDSDIEELYLPEGEWRGWIRNRMTYELEWCIVTAGLIGVFHDPEADQARIVLNLNEFIVKPLCEGAKRGSHTFTYVDDVYSVKFVSKRNAHVVYTFGAETEDDFRTWYRSLTGKDATQFEDASSVETPTVDSRKNDHADAKRTDSGFGDDNGCLDQTPSGNGFVARFDSIEEAQELASDLDSSDNANASGRNATTVCDKSGSSGSLCDSLKSNNTKPDSQISDEVPRLRPTAHKLRVSRANKNSDSAPVGDFAFWEEGAGGDQNEMLTKTYSLPLRSPNRKRGASEGDITVALTKSPSKSEEAIGGVEIKQTPPNRETKPRSTNSDPGRRLRPIGSRMTVKASKFVGRVTNLRSQKGKSPQQRSALAVITIEGDLLRKQKSTIVPCFCVLSGAVLYTYKSQQSEDVSEITIDVAKYRLSKLAAAKSENKELDCAFVLTSHTSGKEYVFIAKDLNLARRWYGHLEDILTDLEARQIRAMHSSAPDLATTSSFSTPSPTLLGGKFTKLKPRGSTFKRLAQAEEEKRNSVAARMSRGSFLDLYGHSEEGGQQRRESTEDITKVNVDSDKGADDADDNAFIDISMEDFRTASQGLDRTAGRSMDDIGLTMAGPNPPSPHHLQQQQSSPGKPLVLPMVKAGPKTKRQTQTVQIPASELEENSIKRGYLEIKKGGSWKRCWVLLTEDCLYIYRKPTDGHTLDMIPLDDYQVQLAILSSNSSKHGSRFFFEIYHPKFNETQLSSDNLDDRATWMTTISESCKKCSSPGRAYSPGHVDMNEKSYPLVRRELTEANENVLLHSEGSDSSSDFSDESPVVERQKQIIEDKYERVKEAEEMEMLRETTILNQRRMSTDVKINAVEKQLKQQKKQRKRKKKVGGEKDEEGAFLEHELENLRERFRRIEKESEETSLKQEERRKTIENKKEVEVKIFEQERKIQRHRKAAKQALQQIVKGISSITPPPLVAGGRPCFDLIAEEAEEEGDSDGRKMSLASSIGISSSESMGSLCEPKRLSTSELSIPEASPPWKTAEHPHTQLVTSTRRAAVSCAPPSFSAARASNQLKTKLSSDAGDSSTDSSGSSMDSPELPRRNMDLVSEFEDYFPSVDKTEDAETDECRTRCKSKSFDSGIADEVDMNSNKACAIMSVNGHDHDKSKVRNSGRTSGGTEVKELKTEISEDVLRDIEEFERIARRTLDQGSWMT